MTNSDLYNSADVRKVREFLLAEQDQLDALTGLKLDVKDAVLDHDHNTQKVRAVIHRQVNAALGKIENIWARYLSYWYPGDLKSFMRQASHYLENNKETRWNHPQWIKNAKTEFAKLNASEQTKFLSQFNLSGKNTKERHECFRRLVLTRVYDSGTIFALIKELKDSR